jgi:hypothetical protein
MRSLIACGPVGMLGVEQRQIQKTALLSGAVAEAYLQPAMNLGKVRAIMALAQDVVSAQEPAMRACALTVRVRKRGFVRNKRLSLCAAVLCLSFATQVCGAADESTATGAPASIRTLDLRSLPSDAFEHSRSKWSGDLYILIDDDAGGPSLYMFDRSGQPQFNDMIQISGADRIRIRDFTAAPDGSVWACGQADSRAGQRSFFLAHITNDGNPLRIIRTSPYAPSYLTVAPDGTIWTVGYSVGSDGRDDLTQDSLRHFDSSGKLIASGHPAQALGPLRVSNGFLDFNQGHVAWYSPTSGMTKRSDAVEQYLEISPTDMTVLHSYPAAPRTKSDFVLQSAITPNGRVFIEMMHAGSENRPAAFDLYELDRSGNQWVLTEHLQDQQLEGSDGESLVFREDLADKSKLNLQVRTPPQTPSH